MEHQETAAAISKVMTLYPDSMMLVGITQTLRRVVCQWQYSLIIAVVPSDIVRLGMIKNVCGLLYSRCGIYIATILVTLILLALAAGYQNGRHTQVKRLFLLKVWHCILLVEYHRLLVFSPPQKLNLQSNSSLRANI